MAINIVIWLMPLIYMASLEKAAISVLSLGLFKCLLHRVVTKDNRQVVSHGPNTSGYMLMFLNRYVYIRKDQ